MKLERSCGVLLHITSLPGRFGTGTLGPEAFRFAELLHAGGQSWWQLLPIGPVSATLGYSPYASTSTFAGNPLFISLEALRGHEWFPGDSEPPACDGGDFCVFSCDSSFIPFLTARCRRPRPETRQQGVVHPVVSLLWWAPALRRSPLHRPCRPPWQRKQQRAVAHLTH